MLPQIISTALVFYKYPRSIPITGCSSNAPTIVPINVKLFLASTIHAIIGCNVPMRLDPNPTNARWTRQAA